MVVVQNYLHLLILVLVVLVLLNLQTLDLIIILHLKRYNSISSCNIKRYIWNICFWFCINISHSGTVTAFDSARQLISLNTTANLQVGNTIAVGSTTGVIANISIASGTATVGTIGDTSGEFFGADGKISEDVMRVQDSIFYQDYSYVVRVGQSINEWRDAIKSTVHPAGWNVFGEVEVVGRAVATGYLHRH